MVLSPETILCTRLFHEKKNKNRERKKERTCTYKSVRCFLILYDKNLFVTDLGYSAYVDQLNHTHDHAVETTRIDNRKFNLQANSCLSRLIRLRHVWCFNRAKNFDWQKCRRVLKITLLK